ncbi:MAG: hypothetical protein ACRDHP_07610 [Ktedonobacterales bacterium]
MVRWHPDIGAFLICPNGWIKGCAQEEDLRGVTALVMFAATALLFYGLLTGQGG